MIVGCICKPYEIQLDGKPFMVKGERLVGKFIRKDKIYFRGVVFDDDDAFGGDTVSLTKKEFEERVEKWCEILANVEKFEKNFYETWKSGSLMNQKEVESFASLGKSDEEKVFRSGFLCGLHERKTRTTV